MKGVIFGKTTTTRSKPGSGHFRISFACGLRTYIPSTDERKPRDWQLERFILASEVLGRLSSSSLALCTVLRTYVGIELCNNKVVQQSPNIIIYLVVMLVCMCTMACNLAVVKERRSKKWFQRTGGCIHVRQKCSSDQQECHAPLVEIESRTPPICHQHQRHSRSWGLVRSLLCQAARNGQPNIGDTAKS